MMSHPTFSLSAEEAEEGPDGGGGASGGDMAVVVDGEAILVVAVVLLTFNCQFWLEVSRFPESELHGPDSES